MRVARTDIKLVIFCFILFVACNVRLSVGGDPIFFDFDEEDENFTLNRLVRNPNKTAEAKKMARKMLNNNSMALKHLSKFRSTAATTTLSPLERPVDEDDDPPEHRPTASSSTELPPPSKPVHKTVTTSLFERTRTIVMSAGLARSLTQLAPASQQFFKRVCLMKRACTEEMLTGDRLTWILPDVSERARTRLWHQLVCSLQPGAACPQDGGWGSWGHWSECGATCGAVGERVRRRLCDRPEPAHGGLRCRGRASEVQYCVSRGCGLDKLAGFMTEHNPSQQLALQLLQKQVHAHPELDTLCIRQHCSLEHLRDVVGNGSVHALWASLHCLKQAVACPIVGGWTEWSQYSECSAAPCGDGQQLRFRTCTDPAPNLSEGRCHGKSFSARDCSVPCESSVGGRAEWAPFGPWSECSASCGVGTQQRHRRCRLVSLRSEDSDRVPETDEVTLRRRRRVHRTRHRRATYTGPKRIDLRLPPDGMKKRPATRRPQTTTAAGGGPRSRGGSGGSGGSGGGTLGKWMKGRPTSGQSDNSAGVSSSGGKSSSSGSKPASSVRKFASSGSKSSSSGSKSGSSGSKSDSSSSKSDTSDEEIDQSDDSGGGGGDVDVVVPSPGGGSGVDPALCGGSSREVRVCEPQCALDGQWSEWGAWSACSSACGPGVSTRDRLCGDPPPAGGGRDCEGVGSEVHYCFQRPCTVETRLLAAFNGSGYLIYRPLYIPAALLLVYVRFRPESGDSVLLHRFQNKCPEPHHCDWARLSLVSGFLVLESTMRQCRVKLEGRPAVQIGHWHEVAVAIVGDRAFMRLDNAEEHRKAYLSCVPDGPNYDMDMYVGSDRNRRSAFHGTVSALAVNYMEYSLRMEADWTAGGVPAIAEGVTTSVATADDVYVRLEAADFFTAQCPTNSSGDRAGSHGRRLDFVATFMIRQHGVLMFTRGIEEASFVFVKTGGVFQVCAQLAAARECLASSQSAELDTWYRLRVLIEPKVMTMVVNFVHRTRLMRGLDFSVCRKIVYVGGGPPDTLKKIGESNGFQGLVESFLRLDELIDADSAAVERSPPFSVLRLDPHSKDVQGFYGCLVSTPARTWLIHAFGVSFVRTTVVVAESLAEEWVAVMSALIGCVLLLMAAGLLYASKSGRFGLFPGLLRMIYGERLSEKDQLDYLQLQTGEFVRVTPSRRRLLRPSKQSLLLSRSRHSLATPSRTISITPSRETEFFLEPSKQVRFASQLSVNRTPSGRALTQTPSGAPVTVTGSGRVVTARTLLGTDAHLSPSGRITGYDVDAASDGSEDPSPDGSDDSQEGSDDSGTPLLAGADSPPAQLSSMGSTRQLSTLGSRITSPALSESCSEGYPPPPGTADSGDSEPFSP
ncbi:uncharacterized protein LOC122381525 [Amphibalanus amphitrite]|uniref:uncharacterized protein LOC122381525 n=1 Tax=Amphibalanus amphitrite TaxID=1232801 RepID=UPI001C91508B|nr:uncharacterized protein LOC122381525 [Amphibalanus amphitrite]